MKRGETFWQKVDRRLSALLADPLYYPPLMHTVSGMIGEKTTPLLQSKVAEWKDLFRQDFIAQYEDVLNWQKNEVSKVSVDPESALPGKLEELEKAYAARVSHLGKPGRSRVFRYDMVWETIWAIMHLDIKPGMKVADIGAENSCVPAYLASKGCEAYGLDVFMGGFGTYFREEVSSRCKDGILKLNVDRGEASPGKVIYKYEDAAEFTYPDNFFDRIVCLSTIEHLFKDSEAMRHMGRALKPGGILAITTPLGLGYSQNEMTPEALRVHDDASHVYDEAHLVKNLIEPSGLRLGDHDFKLSKATWKEHHLPGQARHFVSVAFFLRKESV